MTWSEDVDHERELRRAAAHYERTVAKCQGLMNEARGRLAEAMESAHTAGNMSKAEISRATGDVWSRQWIGKLLGAGRRGVNPARKGMGGRVRLSRREAAAQLRGKGGA